MNSWRLWLKQSSCAGGYCPSANFEEELRAIQATCLCCMTLIIRICASKRRVKARTRMGFCQSSLSYSSFTLERTPLVPGHFCLAFKVFQRSSKTDILDCCGLAKLYTVWLQLNPVQKDRNCSSRPCNATLCVKTPSKGNHWALLSPKMLAMFDTPSHCKLVSSECLPSRQNGAVLNLTRRTHSETKQKGAKRTLSHFRRYGWVIRPPIPRGTAWRYPRWACSREKAWSLSLSGTRAHTDTHRHTRHCSIFGTRSS